MNWKTIKAKVEYLRELGYDVDKMTVNEIIAVYEVLEKKEVSDV